MKKIAILLNSPYLGGAERSIIYQSRLLKKDSRLVYFVPILNSDLKESRDLTSLIAKVSESTIEYYHYPSNLFSLSRTGKLWGAFGAIVGLLKLLFIYKRIRLDNFDSIWANGNKVGMVAYIFSIATFFKGELFWHFRDYPANQGIYKFLWNIYRLPKRFKLTLIGNSNSVTEELKKIGLNNCSYQSIYNPVGEELSASKNEKDGLNIGIVSMFAPWKGLHQIIVWASLFEKEIKELGVTQVSFYGGGIYRTKGGHQSYQEELNLLLKKFPSSLIAFKGVVPPEEIYKEIDILIHPSISPEPFGRIIVEAFSSETPVISSCLGGTSELISHHINGVKFQSFDYAGLTLEIKKIIQNREHKKKLLLNAKEKLLEIESSVTKKVCDTFLICGE